MMDHAIPNKYPGGCNGVFVGYVSGFAVNIRTILLTINGNTMISLFMVSIDVVSTHIFSENHLIIILA